MTGQLWEEPRYFGTWHAAKGFLLNELKDRYVFRGMRDAAWTLETSLDRIGSRKDQSAPAGYRRTESEKILFDSFKKALPDAIHRGPQPPDDFVLPPPDDCVSWLALMRHYGLPSRLLDCTKSPFVAACFAAEPRLDPDCDAPEPQPPDCDFAIWAINEEALQHSAEASLVILRSRPLSPQELGTPTVFSAVFGPPKRFVALVDANHKCPRQKAQQALFLCPGDPESLFWMNLHGNPHEHWTKGSMYKVVLPCGARRDVLADLEFEDLFPPLGETEGLCSSLQKALEESQEDLGHFQWKVVVVPLALEHGLLRVKQLMASPART